MKTMQTTLKTVLRRPLTTSKHVAEDNLSLYAFNWLKIGARIGNKNLLCMENSYRS